MEDVYFKYKFGEDISIELKPSEFVSIIGDNNDLIIHTLLHGNKKATIEVGDTSFSPKTLDVIRRRMSFVLYKHLNVFVGETVEDEIAFGLESLAMKKNQIRELIDTESRHFKLKELLIRDPNSLGASDKVKMKILSALIVKPKILVIDNVLCELDYEDKLLIFDILKEYVKDGAVVIDVGIHRMEDGHLCGDVDFESVSPKASAITPVPGGVGPMTICMLMHNCVEAMKRFS